MRISPFVFNTYRFLAHQKEFNPPTSLCPFARGFAWVILKRLIQLSGILILAAAALYALFCSTVGHVPDHDKAWPFLPYALGAAEFIAAIVAMMAFAIAGVYIKLKIWYAQQKMLRDARRRANGQYPVQKITEKAPKAPNLFWAWLKARKENLCPMLEFPEEIAHKENIDVNPAKYPWLGK